jgi:Glycosyl transferase family 11
VIYVRLSNRLGNQMFQYAAARALAERRQTTVRVDVSAFARPGDWSNYQLWRFPKLKLGSFVSQFSRNILDAARRPLRPISVEFKMNGLGVDPRVNDLPDSALLKGFFTSEQYFVDHSNLIRTLYNTANFLSQEDVNHLASKFPGRTPISVHVRRGDYIGSPLFDIGNLDGYYRECFDRMRRGVPDSYFVIFSDDTDWCLQWPALRGVDSVVMRPPRSAQADLALMVWCSHHIITNSTFSWWAAWLCENPAKRVFMPHRWLNRWSSRECGVTVPGWVEIETRA